MCIRGVGEGSSFGSSRDQGWLWPYLCSKLSSLAFFSMRLRDRMTKKMAARIKPNPSPKPMAMPVISPTWELDLPAVLAALLVALAAASVTVIF